MHLLIESSGTIRCLYDEAIPLGSLGKVSINRGSHVEPTGDGTWLADMGPASGPVLGPFDERSQALAAERQWLEAHWLWADSTVAAH